MIVAVIEILFEHAMQKDKKSHLQSKWLSGLLP